MSNNPVLQLRKDKSRGVSVFDVNVNPEWIEVLIGMGFAKPIAEQGVMNTKGVSLQAAIDWCLSNPNGISRPIEDVMEESRAEVKHEEIPKEKPKVVSTRSPYEEERELVKEKQRKLELEKLKEQKRLEQLEKERVRRQLEEDKQNRKQRQQLHSGVALNPVATSTTQSTTSSAPSNTSTEVTQCVLQLRLPGGQTHKATFKSTDKLITVHKYVTDNLTHDSSFNLITTFPKKEYKDKLLQLTLREADLVPMGTLTVQMVADKGVIIKYEEPIDDDELEVESMSYEQLLELGEKIGKVAPEKRQKEFPIRTFSSVEGQESPVCLVCQCEFEDGDTLKKLPCGHEFHKDCVDQWLREHNKCPVCKSDV